MTTPPSHRRGWSASDASGAIYGTIAASAVIAATARHQPPGRVLALTVATLAIFWLAHVYAEVLSHHLRGATRAHRDMVAAAMVKERPMLGAPALLLLLLLLGVVGLLDEHIAVNLALWAGVAQLAGWVSPTRAARVGTGPRRWAPGWSTRCSGWSSSPSRCPPLKAVGPGCAGKRCQPRWTVVVVWHPSVAPGSPCAAGADAPGGRHPAVPRPGRARPPRRRAGRHYHCRRG